jgi:hypothetical protein
MNYKFRHSKYHNVRTVIDGITFASKKEARKYQELNILKTAGDLVSIEMQVAFRIVYENILICKYIADFVTYDKNGIRHVIDTKGFRTREYIIKKKLVKAFYGIDIEEC